MLDAYINHKINKTKFGKGNILKYLHKRIIYIFNKFLAENGVVSAD